jgi:hypothetical protein
MQISSMEVAQLAPLHWTTPAVLMSVIAVVASGP